ncbi:hypothetical protein ACVR1G_02635 [Streptococcus dentasini]
MTFKKSETLYLLMSLVLMVMIFGLYLLAKRVYTVKPGDVEVAPTHVTSSSSSSKSSNSLEADLADLEANPSREAADDVQKEIDRLDDKTKKSDYQNRLNVILAQMAIDAADASRTADSIQEAQAAIDKVQSQSEKTNLQTQLDTISQGGGLSSSVAQ